MLIQDKRLTHLDNTVAEGSITHMEWYMGSLWIDLSTGFLLILEGREVEQIRLELEKP